MQNIITEIKEAAQYARDNGNEVTMNNDLAARFITNIYPALAHTLTQVISQLDENELALALSEEDVSGIIEMLEIETARAYIEMANPVTVEWAEGSATLSRGDGTYEIIEIRDANAFAKGVELAGFAKAGDYTTEATMRTFIWAR